MLLDFVSLKIRPRYFYVQYTLCCKYLGTKLSAEDILPSDRKVVINALGSKATNFSVAYSCRRSQNQISKRCKHCRLHSLLLCRLCIPFLFILAVYVVVFLLICLSFFHASVCWFTAQYNNL